DLPVRLGAQLLGDPSEAAAKLVEVHTDRVRVHGLAGEEPPRVLVGVVRGLDDGAAELGEERGDAGDDADAVGAAQGEDEAAGNGCSFCPPAADRAPLGWRAWHPPR